MDLQAATKLLREKVGSDCGLGTTLKFDCGSEGIVVIDGASVPNTVSNDDTECACTVGLSLDSLSRLLLGEPKCSHSGRRLLPFSRIGLTLCLQRSGISRCCAIPSGIPPLQFPALAQAQA